ncbi:MAG: aldo/keto reductase [Acidobacteriota bacterium]|nr:aldo/keto reductase [Acidobacteriota bacterium]
MQTKQLGNSDMHLTPIGFGAWAIGGGDWAYAWGPQDDKDSIAAIHKAIDLGINWIDTAAIYGLGHSEEVVARALKTASRRPYVFTKCGMLWNEKREISQSLKSIRREVEESLRRLQVEVIDLYQIHWPVPDAELEEGWSTLAELKKEGKVRWIGASNFSVEQMKRAQAIAPITSLQPPYSMINPAVEPAILPFCLEQGIGVINYAPMHSGLLTGAMSKERVANMPQDDFRRRAKQYQEPYLTWNLSVADLLRTIGERHGVIAGVVAIAWTLKHPAITAAIVGGRNASQVEQVIAALEFRLSDAEYDEINQYLKTRPA